MAVVVDVNQRCVNGVRIRIPVEVFAINVTVKIDGDVSHNRIASSFVAASLLNLFNAFGGGRGLLVTGSYAVKVLAKLTVI